MAFLERLEDRAVPTVLLDVNASGALTYTEQTAGTVNQLTVSTTGPTGTYTFQDAGSTITLSPGATSAGFTVSGNTASGPDTAVSSIAINPGAGSTVTIGSVDDPTTVNNGLNGAVVFGQYGSMSGIKSPVTFTGSPADVTVNDQTDAANVAGTLSGSAGNVTLSGFGTTPLTIPAAQLRTLTVNAGTGADTLAVSFAGTNPVPSGGLNFHGGSGANTLDLTGPTGVFTGETYVASGPGAGTVSFDGTSNIHFSGLKPVNDTVPVANYTFTTPGGTGQSVGFRNGPVVGGVQTATIFDNSGAATPAFELANIGNKTNVVLSVGEGTTLDQQVSLSATTAPAGLTSLAVRTGSGNDLVNVAATAPGVATSVFTGSGNDTVNVTASGLAAGTTLTLNGGPGVSDTLNVDATGQATVNTSTPGTMTFAPGAGTIAYSGFENVNVRNTTDRPLTPVAVTINATRGQTLSNVTVGSFTDADPNAKPADFVATINYGDGTAPQAGVVVANGTGGFSVLGTHTFASTGTFTPAVTVTDRGSSQTTTSGGVTITTSDLGGQATTINSTAIVTLSTIVASPAPAITNAVEGRPLVNVPVATFTDADPTASVNGFTATIDWGDGSPRSSGVITQPGGVGTPFTVRGTHTYANPTAATLPVIVSIVDAAGNRATTTTNVNGVADALLTNGVAVPVSAVEGTAVTDVPVARFTDTNPLANLSQLSATVTFNGGAAVPARVVQVGGTAAGPLFEVRASHLFATAGSFPVGVTVFDTGGRSLAVTGGTATVASAAITARGSTVTGMEGQPLTAPPALSTGTGVVVATFTSANPGAVAGGFTATINWGDGTTSPGTVTSVGAPNGTTFVVTGNHTYAETGTYATSVTIAATAPATGGGQAIATGRAVIADAPLSAATQPSPSITERQPFTGPIVAFQDANPLAPVSDFRATIDWGDGSPWTFGTISQPGGPGTPFLVTGTHTYADAGVNGGTGRFRATVLVVDQGGASVLLANTLNVRDVPITITAQLSPASDSGVSNSDGITNVTLPTFFGRSEPLSVVRILARMAGSNIMPVEIGSARTDASGRWVITDDIPLPDGNYQVFATAIDAAGHTTAITNVTTGPVGQALVIDTVGPRVIDVLFGRLSGQVLVTFQDDHSGLDQRSLVDGQNYTLSRQQNQGRAGNFLVTSLLASPQGAPYAPQGVLVTFNTGNSIRGGTFTFRIHSGGIRDVAGNALDGEYYGFFPSGNGFPGGDFVTQLSAIHRQVFAPRSLIGPTNPEGIGRFPTTVRLGVIQNPRTGRTWAAQAAPARPAMPARLSPALMAHDAALAQLHGLLARRW